MTELKVVDKLNQILIIVHGLRVLYQFWIHGHGNPWAPNLKQKGTILILECRLSSMNYYTHDFVSTMVSNCLS